MFINYARGSRKFRYLSKNKKLTYSPAYSNYEFEYLFELLIRLPVEFTIREFTQLVKLALYELCYSSLYFNQKACVQIIKLFLI